MEKNEVIVEELLAYDIAEVILTIFEHYDTFGRFTIMALDMHPRGTDQNWQISEYTGDGELYYVYACTRG